jgi:hypothetical protein
MRADALLTNEEIQTIIQEAFHPYRCIVQIRDHEQLRFKVMRKNRTLYEQPLIGLNDVRDRDRLTQLILNVRATVGEAGFHLDPWLVSISFGNVG